jgi:ABC-type nitrate/sulfonate/bicarbonate transport system ATPase subunit
VLLLDEPFSAADALKRVQLQDWLPRVVYRHGVTALLVTHDVEVVRLADRVIVLDAAPATVGVAVTLERPREHTGIELAGVESAVAGQAATAADDAVRLKMEPAQIR